MQSLELKIHPPIVMLLCAFVAWLVGRLLHTAWRLPDLAAALLAATLLAAGISVAFTAVMSFHRAKTTIEPTKPHESSTLVTSGIFRITRNPMYLGLFLLLAAWVVYLANPWGLLAPVLFVVYITRFQILPEERILSDLFGADYADYRRRVRRWI